MVSMARMMDPNEWTKESTPSKSLITDNRLKMGPNPDAPSVMWSGTCCPLESDLSCDFFDQCCVVVTIPPASLAFKRTGTFYPASWRPELPFLIRLTTVMERPQRVAKAPARERRLAEPTLRRWQACG